ncbi:MAG: aspartate kinase [Clostridiales bacterium]|jgi:aspartate kinase|nr:aspartate kinase [Clostridiales bacterium]
MKVLKFGGTSMANAGCIKRVKEIVLSDPDAGYVVVSAPGKREAGDAKVTDLLYAAFRAVKAGQAAADAFLPVRTRFDDIVGGLGLKMDLSAEYDGIIERLDRGTTADYIASRGEYLSAKVMAAALGWTFCDTKELIRFDDAGRFMAEETDVLMKKALCGRTRLVLPGFYGADEAGEIRTFSRGGSDVSGAIVARAVLADMYENWTDVDGFLMCDPRIVEDPELIGMITYKELRELSYMGANVLHPESIFPVRKNDIPINIRNTFNPAAPGTLIVPTKKFFKGEFTRRDSTVTGIAGKKDFFAIFIEKSMMNNELGFARRVLSAIENKGLSIEHMPTGVDTLSIVIDGTGVEPETVEDILAEIVKTCRPDVIDIVRDIALIAVVGHGMLRKKGTAAKVCSCLYRADVNIRMIDQGSSELNIIIGVDNADYEKAIACLYREFI